MKTEVATHIQKLITAAKMVSVNSVEYWQLRCRYIEKYYDKTYGDEERHNCYMLWRILIERE